MAIFGRKPWVDPFGKTSTFRLFKLLAFKAQKGVFFSRISLKTISWPILPQKENLEKWPFLDQNHGLTPLEKCQFFDFLNFLFFYLRKAFFRSGISLKTFSWPILPKKKKKLENWPFLDQNHGLTPLKKGQLFVFLNFLFLQLRKALFRSRISLKTFSWPILPKKKSWKNGHFQTKTMG